MVSVPVKDLATVQAGPTDACWPAPASTPSVDQNRVLFTTLPVNATGNWRRQPRSDLDRYPGDGRTAERSSPGRSTRFAQKFQGLSYAMGETLGQVWIFRTEKAYLLNTDELVIQRYMP